MKKKTSEQYVEIILGIMHEAFENDELQITCDNLSEFMMGMLGVCTHVHNQLVDTVDSKTNQEMTYLLNGLVLQKAILSIDKDYFKKQN